MGDTINAGDGHHVFTNVICLYECERLDVSAVDTVFAKFDNATDILIFSSSGCVVAQEFGFGFFPKVDGAIVGLWFPGA
jgi:hypothetical protein